MEKWGNIEASLNEVETKKREAAKKSSKLNLKSGLKAEEAQDFEKIKKMTRVERKRFKRGAGRVGEARDGVGDLSKDEKTLASFRFKNLAEAMRANKKLEDELYGLKIELTIEEDLERVNNDNEFVRNEDIDELDEEIKAVIVEQEKLSQMNPESYIAMHLMELKGYKKKLQEGGLVETNYVKKQKNKLLKSINNAHPVFIHGHLGAGKSELAFSTARDFLIDFNVKKDFKQWMENQEEDYSDCTNEEELSLKEEEYEHQAVAKIKELKKFYEIDESEETQEKLTYYAVSGSKDFSLSDMYTEKTLDVKRLNGFTPDEFADEIEKNLDAWVEKKKLVLDELTDEDKREAIDFREKGIRKAIEMKHSGFGTSVEDIEKEILKGIKEGKPVIIDEVNAIPAELLISMNDILTKRPGQEAFIPGHGKEKIQEGFAIIMTGNMNTGTAAEYFGVQDLNPAFLSRLDEIDYDYVPQDKEGANMEVNPGDHNELFHIMLAKVMDKNGNIEIPGGRDGLEKLFKLAQFARVTQDVFSGRNKDSHLFTDKAGNEFEPSLEKSVLSIRDLNSILEEWNNGREKDLDKALWDKFIEKANVPADQHFLIQQAQVYEFFDESDGWKNHNANFDDPKLTESDMREVEYVPQKQELGFVGAREVVEVAYGKAPERTAFPDMVESEDVEENINMEDLKNLDNFLSDLSGQFANLENTINKECDI